MRLQLGLAGTLVVCQILTSSPALGQGPSREELARALRESEADLDTCRAEVKTLNDALMSSSTLFDRRRAAADAMIGNLESQLAVQDSIGVLMQANSDSLMLMVRDFDAKVNELDALYVKELKKNSRPWWLSGKGLSGFMVGILVGGALGLTYTALN